MDASVALTIAPDVTTEPISLRELLPHSSAVDQGITELFQTKFIAAWSDLLNNLFKHFVIDHLEGRNRFPELKHRSTRIDFSSEVDVASQVREGLISDFPFDKYAERIKIINRVLNPESKCQDELSIIRRHVMIRNSIQHHEGIFYEVMQRELGSQKILILDSNGNQIYICAGESIRLFVPELDHLKGALFRLTSFWRTRIA
jgi:hypothetical protein